ncbi:choriogenin Hminor, partial [Metarhizium hybridum]
MTTSKSFRASMLPSSLSFPSFRSTSNTDCNANSNSNSHPSPDPEKSKRRSLWHKGTTHLPMRRPLPARDLKEESKSATATTPAPAATNLTKEQREQQGQQEQRDPSPAQPLPNPHFQKSPSWGLRLSSLVPLLTPDTADTHPVSVNRKPVAANMIPPPQTPPPPPYVASEAEDERSGSRSRTTTSVEASGSAEAAVHPQESPRAQIRAQIRTVPPIPESEPPEVPEFAISFSTHQTPEILAPIPPSPDSRHAALTKQKPAIQPDTWRVSGAADNENESQKQAKLQKDNYKPRPRRNSLFQPKLPEPQPGNIYPRQMSPNPESRGRRSVSGQMSLAPSGSVSLAPNSRSASSHDGSQSPTRAKLRRSWLPGGARSRSNSEVTNGVKPEAWILSEDTHAEYNPSFLKNGEKVPELWNENGNVYVYLYPRGSGYGPSFKVPEFVVGTSYVFNELIDTEQNAESPGDRVSSFGGRDNLSVHDANRIASPSIGPSMAEEPNALRLYIPAAPGGGAPAELGRLIAIRNLFAFLTGQPLVATKAHPTTFHAFVELAGLLQEFGFSSPDGSTFGEAVELSFGFYLEQLGISDCRHGREKTIESLILGERMRCVELYNEAFAHAAGKYSAIIDLRLPLFEQVSPLTRQRLERAHLDLVNRQHNVNEHLEQFEFPSLFAGIANSTSIPELRQVRFKTWRNSFSRMRQFLLNYYKSTFGNWPPKASNKKNPFAESGLNRLVLKVLYSDMCALYDLLVDRNSLTSRVMDETPAISDEPSKMTISALRNILSEFDRSKPPVLPPIPFDLPQLPSMKAIHETFDNMSQKDQNRMEKKIKEHELILILNKAYNYDTNRIKLPFLDHFKDFEIREGKGKVTHDLVDQRIGYWLFLYVVLQSLPMLVVDAPGVKHTEGVEYFLCEPPMGNLPWIEDGQVRKMWYEVTGGGGIVELSADAVMFSVEATYHRSHCWLAAKQWEGLDGVDAVPPEEPPMSPLQPPQPMFPGEEPAMNSPPVVGGPSTPSPPPGGPQPALRPRNLSPAHRSRQYSRSSIAMGLEPVPMEPPPNVFGSHNRSSSIGPRPPSSHLGLRSASVGNLVGMTTRVASPVSQTKPAATTGATFDDILGETKKKPVAKKRGLFF